MGTLSQLLLAMSTTLTTLPASAVTSEALQGATDSLAATIASKEDLLISQIRQIDELLRASIASTTTSLQETIQNTASNLLSDFSDSSASLLTITDRLNDTLTTMHMQVDSIEGLLENVANTTSVLVDASAVANVFMSNLQNETQFLQSNQTLLWSNITSLNVTIADNQLLIDTLFVRSDNATSSLKEIEASVEAVRSNCSRSIAELALEVADNNARTINNISQVIQNVSLLDEKLDALGASSDASLQALVSATNSSLWNLEQNLVVVNENLQEQVAVVSEDVSNVANHLASNISSFFISISNLSNNFTQVGEAAT